MTVSTLCIAQGLGCLSYRYTGPIANWLTIYWQPAPLPLSDPGPPIRWLR